MKAQVTKQHVGIDIAKDDFKACIMQRLSNDRVRVKASRSFKNTSKGYESLITWVLSKSLSDLELSFSMEATGIYHENLAYYLHEQGYKVSILLANTVKAYAKSLNIKTKTDKTDAKCIAQMGIERNLTAWKPISAQLRQLKQLSRERLGIQKEKTALSNKLHAFSHSHSPNKQVLKLMNQRLKLLDKQLKLIEQLLKETVAKDLFLKERIDNICVLKGLALITVVTVLAETNGFQHFSSKAQLVSYAGYDVIENQSGSSVNGKSRISKKGNARIRKALHFPAMIAKKYEPVYQQLYERIFERTKIKMKALVAVQRKLLVMIYTLFKNNVAFDPNYHKKMQRNNQNCRQGALPAYSG